jgi:hypothetical protein
MEKLISPDDDLLVPSAITDWSQFGKAGLIPTEIVCSEYRPVHNSVTGCHTRLALRRALKNAPINPKTKRPTLSASATSMLDHIKADHGGGFLVTFKREETADKKLWGGWADLKASGIEITDIRCEWCEKSEDRLHAGSLLSHFKPHRGRGRGMKASTQFWMTLAFNVAPESDDEDD